MLGHIGLLMNFHRQLDAPKESVIGKPYVLEYHYRPGYAASIHFIQPMLSLGEARYAIPPYGVLGLDPKSLVPLPLSVIDPDLGKAVHLLQIPLDPGLRGRKLCVQGLFMASSGPTRFTNVITDLIFYPERGPEAQVAAGCRG